MFAQGMTMGKMDLIKGCWNRKRKMWVTTLFSEIIFGNRNSKKALKYNFFPNLSSIVSEKCVVTPNFLFRF